MSVLLLRRLQGFVRVLIELYYDRCLLLLGALRLRTEFQLRALPSVVAVQLCFRNLSHVAVFFRDLKSF